MPNRTSKSRYKSDSDILKIIFFFSFYTIAFIEFKSVPLHNCLQQYKHCLYKQKVGNQAKNLNFKSSQRINRKFKNNNSPEEKFSVS